MLRVSSLLGESLLFFISISILSIITLTAVFPSKNLLILSTRETYLDGYRYGYKVAFLTQSSGYIYLMNIGRNISRINLIYIDGVKYNGSIEIYVNGTWSQNFRWLYGSILRLQNSNQDFKKIDFVIEDRYVIHVWR